MKLACLAFTAVVATLSAAPAVAQPAPPPPPLSEETATPAPFAGDPALADGRWLPLRALTSPLSGVTVVHVLRPTDEELDRAAALGAGEVVVAVPDAAELDALLAGFAAAAERLAQA